MLQEEKGFHAEDDKEDRADVTEPSSGYLVFLPGGKYLEFRNDCCGVAEVMREALPYRIEGAKVILSCNRASGEPYDRTLQHIAIDHVVFFDGIESKPVTTSTLRVGNGPNYGYGKVYP